MATLKIIRKRITSVKNTQKITKAMKMVAAAKLRRAQSAVVQARPYANKLAEVIAQLAEGSLDHPLFKPVDKPTRACFLILTSNRGLCGGFNSNLLRRLETFFKSSPHLTEIDLKIIGKKGRDYYKSRKRKVSEVFIELADVMTFDNASQMTQQLVTSFTEGNYDEYYVVYNQFKSALSQETQIEKLLPFESGQKNAEDSYKFDPIFEPSKEELLDVLIPKYLATQLYRAHLESVASELGARMAAMENATKNAKEMIGQLTLEYNRARQAAITRELLDIVNGAEAIK